MSTAPTLAADRAFNVFGDHSYRMDLRGWRAHRAASRRARPVV